MLRLVSPSQFLDGRITDVLLFVASVLVIREEWKALASALWQQVDNPAGHQHEHRQFGPDLDPNDAILQFSFWCRKDVVLLIPALIHQMVKVNPLTSERSVQRGPELGRIKLDRLAFKQRFLQSVGPFDELGIVVHEIIDLLRNGVLLREPEYLVVRACPEMGVEFENAGNWLPTG